MKIAALYIPQGCLPHIFGQRHDEVTINFGGKNLYQFKKGQLMEPVPNKRYIDELFDDNISLLSCIVGNNGSGKTSLMQQIGNAYNCTYVIETESSYELADNIDEVLRVYYTPYLHHKALDNIRTNFFDFSKFTLINTDNNRGSDQLLSFLDTHNSENLKRWIRFNHFFRSQQSKVRLPVFKRVELILNHFETNIHKPNQFHNTSTQLRPVISLIFEKIKSEEEEREKKVVTKDLLKSDRLQKVTFPIRFEYDLYETAMGKLVAILERAGNNYWDEGYLDEDYETELASLSARDAIEWFLAYAGVYAGNERYSFSGHMGLMNLIDYVVSLINEDSLTDDWRTIVVNEEQALSVIQLYDAFNTSFINDWFEFDTRPMFGFRPDIVVSSGEQSFLDLFSTLYYFIEHIRIRRDQDYVPSSSAEGTKRNLLLLIDEGDNAFHPQWKKEYVRLLREIIPVIFEDFNVQIIITSHDPLTLSDLPRNNVVFLEKVNGFTKIGDSATKRTFGANIADLMKDSFFIQDGQIGSFVAHIIKGMIEEMENGQIDEQRVQSLGRMVSCIDEPILRFKLAEMLSNAVGNTGFEIQLIDEKIRRLQEKKKSI